MVLNICVKFHENVLNGFEVTERTLVCGKNAIFNVQTAISPKVCKPDLRSLRSARRLISLTFVLTFMRISQTVFEWRSGQSFVTDRQTTDANSKNNMSPSPFVGVCWGHNNLTYEVIRKGNTHFSKGE